MKSSKVMQFLNLHHFVGSYNRHLISYLNGNKISGFFNSISETNIQNKIWSFTMFLNGGGSEIIEVKGEEILTIELV